MSAAASSSSRRARAAALLALLVLLLCLCLAPASVDAKGASKTPSSGGVGSPPSSTSPKKGLSPFLFLLLLLFLPGVLIFCFWARIAACCCACIGGAARKKKDEGKFKQVKASDAKFLSGEMTGPLMGVASSTIQTGAGPFKLPNKGNGSYWIGTYTENGVLNTTNYYLSFSDDGTLSGSGVDKDGTYAIQGQYNLSNGHFVWTEDIANQGVQVAIQVQGLNTDSSASISRLQGAYTATTGVSGPLEIVAYEGDGTPPPPPPAAAPSPQPQAMPNYQYPAQGQPNYQYPPPGQAPPPAGYPNAPPGYPGA